VRRHPCPEDGRITLATLTDAGLDKIRESAPAHVESVRRLVIDVLNEDQLRQLGEISALLFSCEGERFVLRERRSSD
jgi:DNA-binding MarR family transcriptional regulator